jgi:hypothetical protein
VYRVRAPAHALEPEAAAAQGRYVATWLPLRCLVAAGLAENFVLQVDEAGRVYALEFTPPGGACAPATGPPPAAPQQWAPRSTASVKLPKDAPPLASTLAARFDPTAPDAFAEPAESARPPACSCARVAHSLRASPAAPHARRRRPAPPRAAAPGSAAEELKERPPEKSFLSKYGLMIGLLVFNLVFRGMGGPPDSEPAAPGRAGGAGGGGAAAGGGGGGAKRE